MGYAHRVNEPWSEWFGVLLKASKPLQHMQFYIQTDINTKYPMQDSSQANNLSKLL